MILEIHNLLMNFNAVINMAPEIQKIVTYILYLLMGADVAVALASFAIVGIKGKGDKNADERKETITKLVWIGFLAIIVLSGSAIIYGLIGGYSV